MSVIASLHPKEKIRNENMIAEHSCELEELPKGSIKPKKFKDKVYYFTFSDGDKFITKYIGKEEKSFISIREQLVRRKQVEEIIRGGTLIIENQN